MPRIFPVWLAFLSLFTTTMASARQIRLDDVTETSGIRYRNVSGGPQKRFIVSSLGAGAGLLDYDQDGDLDVYLVNGAPLEDRAPGRGLPNQLFRNEGNFRFTDQTEAAGVGDTGWGYGVAVADLENDGLPDLYITNLGENVLYRNRGDGTFRRAPGAGGASHPGYSTSAAFLDAEDDGDPDLVLQVMAAIGSKRTGEGDDSDAATMPSDVQRKQAAKRAVVRVHPKRALSWDHHKLGGTY